MQKVLFIDCEFYSQGSYGRGYQLEEEGNKQLQRLLKDKWRIVSVTAQVVAKGIGGFLFVLEKK